MGSNFSVGMGAGMGNDSMTGEVVLAFDEWMEHFANKRCRNECERLATLELERNSLECGCFCE